MNREAIEKSFQPLYGRPCWGLSYDRYLNLSMNFGDPSLRVREPYRTRSASEAVQRMAARRLVTIRGEWWLWLHCCYWRLSGEAHDLATGSSSLRRIQQAVSQLEGQALTAVTIESRTGASRFIFDLGCVLHCRRFERDSDEELWALYEPGGIVLSAHGDGNLDRRLGSDIEKPRQPVEEGAEPNDD